MLKVIPKVKMQEMSRYFHWFRPVMTIMMMTNWKS